MSLLPEGQQNNTEVTFNDQQNINKFSTLFAKKELLTAELNDFKKEKDYLDDLSLELELIDEDELINYKIGETFVKLKQTEVLKRLEKDNSKIDNNVETLESEITTIDNKLSLLKTQLYAKFGTAINLER
ncbi:hypothetical protein B5S31_g1097 [[Candida] boidinii]|nr:hypothetical protein B5S29_g5051 [[Candida] boidinii]OWB71410.1 hypothetical protein B5S31_g1097 [[Candida] boidinii]OWB79699.1 hypothetical protein B5S32_g3933 [[Candida] boidinii]